MARRENSEAKAVRVAQLRAVQDAFPTFLPFLEEVFLELGYGLPSPVQRDIADYLENGPHYQMIQAQRGQAKTTITAAYAVWSLIHNPKYRILVVSADGSGAGDITTMISRLIQSMEFLECLRPDRSQGDRTSNEKFDIHYSLKGVEKSASVMSVGITGTLQGKRADILIADDIESTKNSLTAAMRETILRNSKDFSSQCVDGRILYLGTPQSTDSIYNTLPGRGFQVRIWPGRYPKDVTVYGSNLAPMIATALAANPALATGGGLLGDMGQPTDPTFITEDILLKKQADQGTSIFMLNHMLDTSLSDAMRYPLKTSQAILAAIDTGSLPLTASRRPDLTQVPLTSHTVSFTMCQGIFAHEVSKPAGIMMYVDPAGGGKNGDETGYAVTALLNSTIYVLAAGGLPGGYADEQMVALAQIAKKWQVQEVVIEKNMGYGAFQAVWLPFINREHPCKVTEDYVTGNKEARIINTLEPVLGRGSLVFSHSVIVEDQACCERYDVTKRAAYSLFHQINKITRDTGSLKHDDRVDALEGAVRFWQQHLAVDQMVAMREDEAAKRMAFLRDPFGHIRAGRANSGMTGNLFNKYRR